MLFRYRSRTPKVIRGCGEISVEIVADGWLGEIGHPVLGRKDEMKKNSREGLRHKVYHDMLLLLYLSSCRVRSIQKGLFELSHPREAIYGAHPWPEVAKKA